MNPTSKPYLLRALWEWCVDSGFTPHLAVFVDKNTQVPREFVRNGEIVLNIGNDATHKLDMGNEFIEFQARFGGVARQISIPVSQVIALYARESGEGIAFGSQGAMLISPTPAAEAPPPETEDPPPTPPPAPGRPKLQRVK